MIGLVEGSYEAYCFDEAVWFLGVTINNELDSAGQKESKESRKTKMARDLVIQKYFGTKKSSGGSGSGFADPSALFS